VEDEKSTVKMTVLFVFRSPRGIAFFVKKAIKKTFRLYA